MLRAALMQPVRELRLVLTVEDFDAALAFYRDALGLEPLDAWEAEEGRPSRDLGGG
jgi:catechol 2,3-dioxygenase-like lactoylglutathione lyase family enzyme